MHSFLDDCNPTDIWFDVRVFVQHTEVKRWGYSLVENKLLDSSSLPKGRSLNTSKPVTHSKAFLGATTQMTKCQSRMLSPSPTLLRKKKKKSQVSSLCGRRETAGKFLRWHLLYQDPQGFEDFCEEQNTGSLLAATPTYRVPSQCHLLLAVMPNTVVSSLKKKQIRT